MRDILIANAVVADLNAPTKKDVLQELLYILPVMPAWVLLPMPSGQVRTQWTGPARRVDFLLVQSYILQDSW